MKIGTKIALAAIVVASFAAPALAGEWVYHGGPKSPDSLTSYVPQVYYGGLLAGSNDLDLLRRAPTAMDRRIPRRVVLTPFLTLNITSLPPG